MPSFCCVLLQLLPSYWDRCLNSSFWPQKVIMTKSSLTNKMNLGLAARVCIFWTILNFPVVLTCLGEDQASTCYCPEDSSHSVKQQGHWGCCVLETHDYCSAREHCFPGDYCFIYDKTARCCPKGISCIQINGELLIEQTVYWYQEVHTLITSRYLEHSVMGTPTRLTVTASYPQEASSSYSFLSWSVRNAATTLPPLDQLTTRTASMTIDSALTSLAPWVAELVDHLPQFVAWTSIGIPRARDGLIVVNI